MRITVKSSSLKRIVLVGSFCVSLAATTSAQTRQGATPNLERALAAGMTVWITDSDGREEKARLVSVSGDAVTRTTGDAVWRFQSREMTRVRVRRSDSLINGALIGAGVAVSSGLLFCRAMEPWRNCIDDYGPMVRIGALGAGIGIGIDALIRGRRTIYEAPESTRFRAAPLVTRSGAGLQVLLRF